MSFDFDGPQRENPDVLFKPLSKVVMTIWTDHPRGIEKTIDWSFLETPWYSLMVYEVPYPDRDPDGWIIDDGCPDGWKETAEERKARVDAAVRRIETMACEDIFDDHSHST